MRARTGLDGDTTTARENPPQGPLAGQVTIKAGQYDDMARVHIAGIMLRVLRLRRNPKTDHGRDILTTGVKIWA